MITLCTKEYFFFLGKITIFQMAMKSFNNLFVVVVFLASLSFLINTSQSSEIQKESQGPSIEVNQAPRPLSSYEKYLTNCASKLKPNCGQQVFFGVFVGNQTVSDFCCENLVNDMGKSCHVDLTKFATSSPTFKKNGTQIIKRCYKVWDDCNAVHHN